ncbi:MAG: beta-Ala-His dipeptidase [Clostridia bacterium]|nr:beta-Ala-His dipeptidase [Clostridia bacterium]
MKWKVALLAGLLVLAMAVPAWGESAGNMPEEDAAIVDDIIDNFMLLAAIPRQSKHEQAVSDFLKGWAEDLGYTVRQNEANDLFFYVPATPGCEALPLTALQTHLDMVCVAEEGRSFDPQADPIRVIVDKAAGTMTADGTTLGADDGAGVAIIMSIAKGKMAHGPLRIIFTTDEEVDMTGALAVTAEDLSGVKYLINIDSEWSDSVTVSSAASSLIVTKDAPKPADAKGDTAVSITLSGLLGGHSGLMIGEGRCNGITALAKVLADLPVPYALASFTGGIADNAIPAKAQAVVVIDGNDQTALAQYVAEKEAALREAYAGIESGLALAVEKTDAARKVLDAEQTQHILAYVAGAIDGVYTMSEVIDGLVESSSNLGLIQADASGIEIRQMPRSSSAERLKDIEDHHRALAAEQGLSVDIADGSRPWPVKADSVLVQKIRQIYREQNGEEIKVEAIHAGLECGAFSELAEGLDMVSIGPDVANAHSPEETLYLSSIPKTWHLLESLLVSLDE